MGRDPEDGEANDPKTLHKYLYAGGDPVNWVDPSGRTMADYPLLIQIGATAAIIGIEATFVIETLELWDAFEVPPGGNPPTHPAPGSGEPGPGGGCPLCGEGGPPEVPPGGSPIPPWY